MPGFGKNQGSGSGVGRGGGCSGGFRMGPGGFCTCPACGHKAKHQQGIPCFDMKCPQCGAVMTRERS
jgi:hypothetical protein